MKILPVTKNDNKTSFEAKFKVQGNIKAISQEAISSLRAHAGSVGSPKDTICLTLGEQKVKFEHLFDQDGHRNVETYFLPVKVDANIGKMSKTIRNEYVGYNNPHFSDILESDLIKYFKKLSNMIRKGEHKK